MGVFKWPETLTADANEEDHVEMVLGRARIGPACVYYIGDPITPPSEVLRLRTLGHLELLEGFFAYNVDFILQAGVVEIC